MGAVSTARGFIVLTEKPAIMAAEGADTIELSPISIWGHSVPLKPTNSLVTVETCNAISGIA